MSLFVTIAVWNYYLRVITRTTIFLCVTGTLKTKHTINTDAVHTSEVDIQTKTTSPIMALATELNFILHIQIEIVSIENDIHNRYFLTR